MSKKGPSWRTHIIELLVVIIGISIAFALEGWSENRKEKTLEINYLNSLKADLQKDQDDMLEVLDSSAVISGLIMETFGFVYSGQNVEVYHRNHITSSYTAPYFYPNNGTYISLINSGSLNIISDFELKAKLAELYNVQYKELERVDNFIKNLVDDMIYPYMLKHIKFSARRDGIEDAGPLKVNEAVNMLGSYMNFLMERRNAYDRIKPDFDSLIIQIDAHLEKLK